MPLEISDSIEEMDVESQSGEPESGKEFVELIENLDHEDKDNPKTEIPEPTMDNCTKDMNHETEILKPTSNKEEMDYPDDIVLIDSIPNKASPLKARIVNSMSPVYGNKRKYYNTC